MKLFGQNWSRLHKTLSSDAAIFSHNVQSQPLSVKKPLFIVSTIAIISAFSVLGMAKYPNLARQTSSQETIESMPIVSVSMLYDLRTDVEYAPDTTQRLTLKSGQSLGPLLQKNGVDASTTYQIVQAFASVYKPRNLRAEQKINLFTDGISGAVIGLTLKPDSESTIFVSKTGDNNFKSRQVFAEYDKQIVHVKSKIKNSLYLDAQALGTPDKVIVQFSQIYAHSVDFQRDIRAGDSFEMLYEVYRDHRGQTVKAGDLIYTSFAPRGQISEYYLYTKSNGREGYYDKKGKGAKRMLMRTPISGARLSSRFGKRKHPILGYVKSHSGVDFAARRGTPIMAAGTGTIKRAGRYGGYGNYVSISHGDGYATAYAHMSKFARGIRRGVRVRQGQTIGYVGTTGLSTGPHLHYEVHRKGRKINPMSLATLSGKPLQKQEMPGFKTRIQEINALRANIEKTSQPKPEPELSVELNPQDK